MLSHRFASLIVCDKYSGKFLAFGKMRENLSAPFRRGAERGNNNDVQMAFSAARL